MSKLSNMNCINICATKTSTREALHAFCCHDTPHSPASHPSTKPLAYNVFALATSFKLVVLNDLMT